MRPAAPETIGGTRPDAAGVAPRPAHREVASPGALATFAVLAVSCLTVMANATISPSLPGLREAFAGTPDIDLLSGLVLSLPSLAVVATAAFAGAVVDRVGARPVLMLALALYAFGGASGLVVESLPALLAGRFALGLGVAGTMTVATVLAARGWTGAARERFMGRQGAAMSGGGIAFLVGGGLLAEWHWRAPFAIYLLALPLAWLAWRAVARLDREGPEARPDGGGAPTEAGPGAGRDSGTDPGAARLPRGTVAAVAALAFLSMLAFYLVPTKLPFRLEALGVTSPAVTGLTIAAMTAAGVPAALSFGRLRARAGAGTLYAASFALLGAGYVAIGLAGGIGAVAVGALVAGVGLGLLMPNQNAFLMARVPPALRGRASGILTTAVFAGQFLSPLLASAVIAATGLAGSFLGFAAALLAIAGIVLASRARFAERA